MTNASTEMVRAVQISESVKHIVGIAFKVRSIATNAILLAHRAGEIARGFSVLSKELRSFTDQVTGQMETLSDLAFRLMVEVSNLLRQTHRTNLLKRALDEVRAQGIAVAQLEQILSRRDDEECARAIARLRAELATALAATDRLGQFGAVLARTALIEAAYGGKYREELKAVAQDFNQTIIQILEAMQQVHSAYQFTHRNDAGVQ